MRTAEYPSKCGIVKKASGCAASTASFSLRSSTRTARIGPSGGAWSPNRRRSALLNGRSHANALPATDQVRPPCRSPSVASGSSAATAATSSKVATFVRYCLECPAIGRWIRERRSGQSLARRRREPAWLAGDRRQRRQGQPGRREPSSPCCRVLLIVAVDRIRGEGGQADGDVLGAAWFRAAVAHPFARPGMYCLASPDRHAAALVVHHQGAVKHDCEFIELGALPRLGPASRAAHVRDTEPGIARVGPAHVFFDQLRRFTRGGHLSRLANQFWHARQYPAGADQGYLRAMPLVRVPCVDGASCYRMLQIAGRSRAPRGYPAMAVARAWARRQQQGGRKSCVQHCEHGVTEPTDSSGTSGRKGEWLSAPVSLAPPAEAEASSLGAMGAAGGIVSAVSTGYPGPDQ